MVPLKTAVDGLHSFAVNDVIPLMPNGPRKFGAYMVAGSLRTNPELLMKPYEGFLKMSGIMSGDGAAVDERRLSEALSEAFANMPSLDLLGFTFSADDAARLVDRVTKGA